MDQHWTLKHARTTGYADTTFFWIPVEVTMFLPWHMSLLACCMPLQFCTSLLMCLIVFYFMMINNGTGTIVICIWFSLVLVMLHQVLGTMMCLMSHVASCGSNHSNCFWIHHCQWGSLLFLLLLSFLFVENNIMWMLGCSDQISGHRKWQKDGLCYLRKCIHVLTGNQFL